MTAVLGRFWRVVSLGWLTGPVLAKELRVASRRRRSYLLRVAYLGLMLCFVALVYTSQSKWQHSIDRMAEVGKVICATIVGVQFAACQLFAVIMCSTAISEERYRRTLGVLMTTPITGLQIVMGKLLARTLQLFMLLALSLPLLALVRVFGGVPWGFLVSGLCVTATAMIFAATVSLFFSIFTRHAFAVILMTLLAGAILYMAVPGVIVLSLRSNHSPPFTLLSILLHANPFAVWMVNMQELFQPGAMSSAPFFYSWQVHCAGMLAASGLLLFWAVALVRKAALHQVAGDSGSGGRKRARIVSSAEAAPAGIAIPAVADGTAVPTAAGEAGFQPAIGRAGFQPADGRAGFQPADGRAGFQPADGRAGFQPADGEGRQVENLSHRQVENLSYHRPASRVRRVGNWPVLWRELRVPLVRSWVVKLVLYGVVSALLIAIYALTTERWNNLFHTFMCSIYLVGGLLATAVVSATTATLEKEAGSWDILLASPLRAVQVIGSKMIGALWRVWPVWIPLLGHLLWFSLASGDGRQAYIMSPGGWLIAAVVASTAVFIAGTGVLLSVICRKTTMAVSTNVGLGIALWVALPIILAISASRISRYEETDPNLLIISANPGVQNVVLIEGLSESFLKGVPFYSGRAKSAADATFHWPDRGARTFRETVQRVIAFAMLHVAAGLAAALLAAWLCRRRVT